MKKIALMLLVVLMAFCFVACDNAPEEKDKVAKLTRVTSDVASIQFEKVTDTYPPSLAVERYIEAHYADKIPATGSVYIFYEYNTNHHNYFYMFYKNGIKNDERGADISTINSLKDSYPVYVIGTYTPAV